MTILDPGCVAKTYPTYWRDFALLAVGNNVLAVEIHQADLGSSDVSFDLSLTAQFITNSVIGTAVYLSSPAKTRR